MNKATLKKMFRNLRAGQTLYKVYALGDSSFINEIVVGSPVRDGIYGKYYHIRGWSKFKNQSVVSTHYVMDINGFIGEPGYNNHKGFTSRRKAKKYLEECIRYNIRYDRTGCDLTDMD